MAEALRNHKVQTGGQGAREGAHAHLPNTADVHTLICPCIKVDDLEKGKRAE